MTLEFNKVIDQVAKMGSMIDKLDFDMADKLLLARQRFEAASDLNFIRERVALVRGPEVSGYRGAAPLDDPLTEPINRVYPAPPLPEHAVILAADGSQVYPDEQASLHYYLINIGLFTYFHGDDRVPEPRTLPHLAFHKSEIHDSSKRLVSNRTVDARRTVQEMQELANACWDYRRNSTNGSRDGILLALYDNQLLFWANSDVTNSDQVTREYHHALVQLHDAGAILAGYVDNPHRSRVVLRLLFLLSLRDDEEVIRRQKELAEGGDLEGLRDKHLFQHLLAPGERSALMVQNSPKNLAFKQRGISYEIAFFYVKVGDWERSAIARVDVPVWVARMPGGIDYLHGLLLAQASMQGRNPYPYALTRADELARVTGKDKRKLDDLINLELRRRGIDPRELAAKARGKLLAHSERRSFELRSDINRDEPW